MTDVRAFDLIGADAITLRHDKTGALVMLLLVPETMQTPLLLLLLVLGNVVFVLYDVLIPRIAYLLNKRLSAFLR